MRKEINWQVCSAWRNPRNGLWWATLNVNITLELMVDQTEGSASAQNTPSHLFSIFTWFSPTPRVSHISFPLCLSSHLCSVLRSFPISHPAERVELPSCQYGEILYVLTNCFTSQLWLMLTMSDFRLPALLVIRQVSGETEPDLLWLRVLGPQINALQGTFFQSYTQSSGLQKIHSDEKTFLIKIQFIHR